MLLAITTARRPLLPRDAGANLAIFRQNQVATSDTLFCVVESVSQILIAETALGDGWCTTQSGTVGDSSYQYRTKVAPALTVNRGGVPVTVTRRISIVSTGTSNGVSRRVKVTAIAPTGRCFVRTRGRDRRRLRHAQR